MKMMMMRIEWKKKQMTTTKMYPCRKQQRKKSKPKMCAKMKEIKKTHWKEEQPNQAINQTNRFVRSKDETNSRFHFYFLFIPKILREKDRRKWKTSTRRRCNACEHIHRWASVRVFLIKFSERDDDDRDERCFSFSFFQTGISPGSRHKCNGKYRLFFSLDFVQIRLNFKLNNKFLWCNTKRSQLPHWKTISHLFVIQKRTIVDFGSTDDVKMFRNFIFLYRKNVLKNRVLSKFKWKIPKREWNKSRMQTTAIERYSFSEIFVSFFIKCYVESQFLRN